MNSTKYKCDLDLEPRTMNVKHAQDEQSTFIHFQDKTKF